jgi:acyl-CoA thioesterase I
MFHTRGSLWLALGLTLFVASCSGGGACRFGFGSEPSSTGSGAAAPAQAASADPQARPQIVILGDSITAGYGLLESEAYPFLLQQKVDEDGYNFEIVNAGVSGDTSAGGLRRLDWALQGTVKILILELGANDGLRGLPVAEMKQNLTTIIERARERNILVVLTGMEAPPNYGAEYVKAFRSTFSEIAVQQKVLFIPFLLDRVAGEAALNQADGIHPNQEGSKIIADTVWQTLRPLLDQMTAAS